MRAPFVAGLLLFAAAIAPAMAGTTRWTRAFAGQGFASTASRACSDARSNAKVNALAPCLGGRGSVVDERFDECDCQEIRKDVHACSVSYKITCERSEPEKGEDSRGSAGSSGSACAKRPGYRAYPQSDGTCCYTREDSKINGCVK